MADYSAQAASIYDPQLQGDTAVLAAENKANQGSFTNEGNAANSAYTDAIAGNTKATDTAIARDNFTASTHGLWSSGLAANGVHATNQAYLDNASKIELARAQKLSDIATRRTASDQGYQARVGALQSKYSGEKANYIATHQNEDAKIAYQEQQANARAARTAAAKQPSLGQTKLGTAQQIAGALSKSTGGDGKVSPDSYAAAKADWVAQGYSAKEFDTQFGNFVNKGKLSSYTLEA